MVQTLAEIHDACLVELSFPKSSRLTVAQDAILRARLLYIIKHAVDPVVASRLFREAMDGV